MVCKNELLLLSWSQKCKYRLQMYCPELVFVCKSVPSSVLAVQVAFYLKMKECLLAETLVTHCSPS